MFFFGFLYIPLFCYMRRSIAAEKTRGGVWALILGSIVAVVQFFLGYFIRPGGFGFSRWLFGFVDIVSVPVLIPLLVYTFIFIFSKFSGSADFSGFTQLWLVPVAAMKIISWGTTNDPILLIIVPLLWVALSSGISFFIRLIIDRVRWYLIITFALCIIIMPVLAASVYWAFFSQRTLLGFVILIISHIPLAISIVFDIKGKHEQISV